MSFSKQQVVVTAITLALLLVTPHLVAGGKEETIAPLDTCESPTGIPCWRNGVCIPACVAKHYTGGFCKGPICVCTKQCLGVAEAETTEAGGPSQPPVVEAPLGKRGMGMLNF